MSTVAINGLGRIGRAALRILLDADRLELVAVNDIADADNLAYLLKYDTVYGRYPVGSVADIVFVAGRPTTADEVNDAFRQEAETARYDGILGVSEDPLVSSDIIGDPRAAVVDMGLTRVVDGTLVKVMAWYDNEWGFTHQMIREARRILA